MSSLPLPPQGRALAGILDHVQDDNALFLSHFFMFTKEPTYKQALSHGLTIAKKHKLLWLFGFFATLLGQMGILDLIVNVFVSVDQGVVAYAAWFDFPALLQTLGLALSQLPVGVTGWAWLVWLLVFFVGVKLLLIFISVVSQSALIQGVAQSMKKGNKQIDVSRAWHTGVGHFWPVFFINVLRRFAIVIMAMIIGVAAVAYAQAQFVGAGVIFFIVFILALLVGMALSFLAIYAVGYVVLEEQTFSQAIANSWNLFRKHTLVSLEVGLVLLIVNLIGSLFAAVAVLLFVAQMAIFWGLALILQSSLVWAIGYLLGFLVLLIAIVLIGTLLTVYTTTVWTYLFVKMHKKGLKSRVLHGLRLVFGK